MPVFGDITYVIKGIKTEERRASPVDAFYVYEVFVRDYGEANVHITKERMFFEVISPNELRTLADQEKRLLEERRLRDKKRQA